MADSRPTLRHWRPFSHGDRVARQSPDSPVSEAADSPNGWQLAVLAAVGVGAAGVVAVFFTKLRAFLEAAGDWLIGRVFGGGAGGVEMLTFLAEFNGILNETRKIDAVTRVVVFVGHNGGGLPTPGSPYVVRSQTGWTVHEGDTTSYESYAFDLQVDEAYCEMLRAVIRDTRVKMTVANMVPGILKSIYENEKVIESVLYSLHVDKRRNRFGFVSVASNKRQFTPNELAMLDILISRLRATFSLRGS